MRAKWLLLVCTITDYLFRKPPTCLSAQPRIPPNSQHCLTPTAENTLLGESWDLEAIPYLGLSVSIAIRTIFITLVTESHDSSSTPKAQSPSPGPATSSSTVALPSCSLGMIAWPWRVWDSKSVKGFRVSGFLVFRIYVYSRFRC